MGDFMKSIFGGSTSTQSSQSTQTPKDMIPQQFGALRGPFAQVMRRMLRQAKGQNIFADNGFSNFLEGSGGSDTFAAPIGANETELLAGMMDDYRTHGMAGGGGRTDYLNDVMGGKYLPGQEGGNPYLDALVESGAHGLDLATQKLLGETMPGRFALAGQNTQRMGSSAFDRAAATALGEYAHARGDIATKIYGGAYEGERGRQQEAVGLSQKELETTVSNLKAQALPRMIEQYGIDKGLEQYNKRLEAILGVLQIAGGMTAPTIATEGQSTSEGETDSQSGIVPGLGGLFSFSGKI